MNILALDPSTEVTAAVVNTYDDETGCLLLCQKFSFDAYAAAPAKQKGSSLDNRLYRIALTRHALAVWVHKCVDGINSQSVALDLVAYEMDTQRGFASSEALKMAAGNYLTIRHVLEVPKIGVSRQQACLATGTYQVYRQSSGKTAAEKAAKKLRLKQAVLAAVNAKYDLSLTSDQDAIADACAVAEYAMQAEIRRRREEAEVARIKAEERAKFRDLAKATAVAKRKKKVVA